MFHIRFRWGYTSFSTQKLHHDSLKGTAADGFVLLRLAGDLDTLLPKVHMEHRDTSMYYWIALSPGHHLETSWNP